MYGLREGAGGPTTCKSVARGAAAILVSAVLGAAGPSFAADHGGGGFHGGGFHGRGFDGGSHGEGFHGGNWHGSVHGYAWRHHGRYGYGFYPGLGLGLAFGAGYPWGWDYYYPSYDGYYGAETPYGGYYGSATPYDGYYGLAAPYAAPNRWYCSNPAGYYPYVRQCYSQWQSVPAG